MKHIDISVVPSTPEEMRDRITAHSSAGEELLQTLLTEYAGAIEYTKELVLSADASKSMFATKANEGNKGRLERLKVVHSDVHTRLQKVSPDVLSNLASILWNNIPNDHSFSFELGYDYSFKKGEFVTVVSAGQHTYLFILPRNALDNLEKTLRNARLVSVQTTAPEPKTRPEKPNKMRKFTREDPTPLTGQKLIVLEALISLGSATYLELAAHCNIPTGSASSSLAFLLQSRDVESTGMDGKSRKYSVTKFGEERYLALSKAPS